MIALMLATHQLMSPDASVQSTQWHPSTSSDTHQIVHAYTALIAAYGSWFHIYSRPTRCATTAASV